MPKIDILSTSHYARSSQVDVQVGLDTLDAMDLGCISLVKRLLNILISLRLMMHTSDYYI